MDLYVWYEIWQLTRSNVFNSKSKQIENRSNYNIIEMEFQAKKYNQRKYQKKT